MGVGDKTLKFMKSMFTIDGLFITLIPNEQAYARSCSTDGDSGRQHHFPSLNIVP